ncbi:DUF4349 domain-containing protein [bacterium]|nr:DUF4349 domain-containing protein [bacterium]
MSEMKLFNRWTVKKKHFWLAVGLGVPALCVVTILVFAFLSPMIGASGYSMDTADFGGMASPAEYINEDEAFYMGDGEYDDKTTNIAMDIDTSEAVASTNGAVVTQRLIIREGNISISVDGTLEARSEIQAIVESLAEEGAYIVTSSENGRGEGRQPYINMVVRIPVGQFDAVMDRIAAMGIEVDERYETAQDVTEEYVDLEGRIEAMEISIERLKEFMADAEFTEDLLNAEAQLTTREAELEALQGRLNYLAESAALSAINISLIPYELSEPIDNSWKPAETFRNAVENLLDSLQGFADFMIYFVIFVLPWLVFFGLIIWGVVAAVRRRRSKRKANSAD